MADIFIMDKCLTIIYLYALLMCTSWVFKTDLTYNSFSDAKRHFTTV